MTQASHAEIDLNDKVNFICRLSDNVQDLHQLIRPLSNLRVETSGVDESEPAIGIEIANFVGYFSVTGLRFRQFRDRHLARGIRFEEPDHRSSAEFLVAHTTDD